VVYSRSQARGLYFDLEDGDPGLLVFLEADLAQWRQQGEPGAPADRGRHSLQSAVFFPGLVARGEEATLPAGTTVLEGGDTRLGGPTATEKVIQGDAYRTAHLAWAGAVSAAITALGGDVTGALTTLGTDTAAALSSKVKTE
jgi:hypothetical protein